MSSTPKMTAEDILKIAKQEGVKGIKALKDQGIDINAWSVNTFYTALQLAIEDHDEKSALALIEAGADLQLGEKTMGTPLAMASSHRMLNVIQRIVERDKSTLNTPAPHGNTPILLVFNNAWKVDEVIPSFNCLFSAGADLTQKTANNETLLHFMALHGWVEGARLVLNRNPELLNIKNKNNQTALDWAFSYKKLEFLKFLLKEYPKATSFSPADQYGNTIFHSLAMSSKNTEFFKLAVWVYKSLLNAKLQSGEIPLESAFIYENLDNILILIKAGSEIPTSLYPRLITAKNPLLLETALSKNPSILHREDEEGRTLLYHAAQQKTDEAFQLLLDLGADELQTAKDGTNAFRLVTDKDIHHSDTLKRAKWMKISSFLRPALEAFSFQKMTAEIEKTLDDTQDKTKARDPKYIHELIRQKLEALGKTEKFFDEVDKMVQFFPKNETDSKEKVESLQTELRQAFLRSLERQLRILHLGQRIYRLETLEELLSAGAEVKANKEVKQASESKETKSQTEGEALTWQKQSQGSQTQSTSSDAGVTTTGSATPKPDGSPKPKTDKPSA